MTHPLVLQLLEDIRDLQAMLDCCDDGHKAIRLRLILQSREQELDRLRNAAGTARA